MSEPVVITGLGVVAPIGIGVPEFQRRLFAGEHAIGPMKIAKNEAESITFAAAPVRDFVPEKLIEKKRLTLLDRFSQFAIVAAREAWANAGFTQALPNPERAGVIFGSGAGGMNTMEEQYERMHAAPLTSRLHPFTVPRLMVSASSSQISMELGLTGPNFTITSACASATHAMGIAMQMIRSGQADIIISGGSEASLNLGTMKGWEALRVMAPDLCRPFSAGRQGMIMGEGAGVLVLESASHAKKRGAKILATVTGFGMSADARDLTTPDQDGMQRAMANALKDAGLKPADIDHINAHGTGTRANDTTESAAINAVLGAHGAKVPVTANKSLFGHAIGAAGALESVAAVLTLQESMLPPTVNFTEPDPECPVTVVNTAEKKAVRHILKNSFAFGGLNACLIVSRSEQ